MKDPGYGPPYPAMWTSLTLLLLSSVTPAQAFRIERNIAIAGEPRFAFVRAG
jgi:hypothetical protein